MHGNDYHKTEKTHYLLLIARTKKKLVNLSRRISTRVLSILLIQYYFLLFRVCYLEYQSQTIIIHHLGSFLVSKEIQSLFELASQSVG